LKDLNYYGLKVSGLKEGKYSVSMDGKAVGNYSASDLAKGVNLGNLDKGPLFDRGYKISEAIAKKNGLVHQRFRNVVMFQAPDWLADVVKERKPAELKKRMSAIEAKQKEIYDLAKPKAVKFEIKAVKGGSDVKETNGK
jgi:hypothetical protein